MVTCSYIEISKFVHDNHVTEAIMTGHIGFVDLSTAVTTDGKISCQVTEAKMTVHIGHF